ncbi:hypothetical protein EDB86DRAFT_2241048 [Lactarius hatsudake]|nr:hypothetical protein EDB86DRAFT_2241048 [Lactarius hatsudake]
MSGHSLLFPHSIHHRCNILRRGRKTSAISRPQQNTSLQQDEQPAEQPLPLRSLLTRPVVISITNYWTLALLEIAASALIPLVWSTAIELGLTPADIGLWMSAYGCVSTVFQFAFFPCVIARFGPGHHRSRIWPILCPVPV